MFRNTIRVKDVVFLAIVSAVTLCTCAVMPLVASLQTVIFGIAQVVTSLQIALFFAVGLMKVRKPGALFLMALFTGLFQLLMSPPMFVSNILIGLFLELIVYFVFHGYEKDGVVFFAAMCYNPLSLPVNYCYNRWFGREAMALVAEKAPWITVLMCVAVVALSALGAWIGIRISKELKKSGVMKS